MSAKLEQAKPMLEGFIPQTYIPELDLSKLSRQTVMNKSWFYNLLVIIEKPEAVPEQSDKPF